MNVYCVTCGNRAAEGTLLCPIDGSPMRSRASEQPLADPPFIYFDHEFTPVQARDIVLDIPPDSYHWADIDRKAPQATALYTQIMRNGKWQDQTLESGYYGHPVRFNTEGEITHGVIRLLACSDAGRSFRTAVLCPAWMKERLEHGSR